MWGILWKISLCCAVLSSGLLVRGLESGYYRIQAELLQLQNPLGVRHDGALCDNFGTCDPVIKVFLDTSRPMAAFPGARYISQYQKIFTATDQNEPLINKMVHLHTYNLYCYSQIT
ncbi:hypothetical protein RvY_14841-3 [Ramazzottius varieornatus]|uniref:Uncharacterized protein n=1 Tax=Ramazzottius varieornatus TaxID=947166 RepID=A0A1D1VUG2_RAMVA|nr:hypothetical protein RvY_14841-3 [Ramazzottius varieornatus]